DEDARHSNGGTVSDELLTELMSHPFVSQPPPKSTGRDEFGVNLVDEIKSRFPLPPSDLLRSLVRFTGRSIAANIRQSVEFQDEVDTLIVSGGGVHHPLVMSDLQAELPGMQVVTSQELGIDPDLKEALLMAVLAVAHVEGVPGNMPGVTGAREEVVLGQLAPAQGAS
ncbi:MAG: anhydro-N-acetylmuramic acid kinase, partial [Candidatus Neomarinimicrobiota bacterium]